ncbi:hypothetical protein FKG96_06245 [Olivibacter sp. LS-1]|uniref:hypothetical protein n=1 Tax=unclassified Olivibacter TaxID=2632301 RepID=UPI0011EA9420|nr:MULTISPECIES: hypothetical protein [unclassified Olivibacter]MDM8176590.1 hypothetical protein [Olivibacter sp. 47]QEL00425.1 hypothetical protein FKG96_06245 [Olivibacter sp. LS-1]
MFVSNNQQTVVKVGETMLNVHPIPKVTTGRDAMSITIGGGKNFGKELFKAEAGLKLWLAHLQM